MHVNSSTKVEHFLPVPCCNQCHVIQAEGIWSTSQGEVAATTKKLSICARCHLTRYCNIECQKKDWRLHKNSCIANDKTFPASSLDKIVASQLPASRGKIIVHTDAQKNVLRTENVPIKDKEADFLSVEVVMEDKKVGSTCYVLCQKVDFDWKTELTDILNPPTGIHNPGALVELGLQMIKKGLHKDAFEIMSKHTPKHLACLQDMFFPQAIKIMHAQQIDRDTMVALAALLNRNYAEVDNIITSPLAAALPEDLQWQIENAEKLPYGHRDFTIGELAKKVIELGLYDKAFDLMFDWVVFSAAKISFFRVAVEQLIIKGVAFEKIVQLAKKMGLTEPEILNEAVASYAVQGHIPFACELAKKSTRSDYYLELIFSALLNKGQKEEAIKILPLVSPAKARDLQFYI